MSDFSAFCHNPVRPHIVPLPPSIHAKMPSFKSSGVKCTVPMPIVNFPQPTFKFPKITISVPAPIAEIPPAEITYEPAVFTGPDQEVNFFTPNVAFPAPLVTIFQMPKINNLYGAFEPHSTFDHGCSVARSELSGTRSNAQMETVEAFDDESSSCVERQKLE